MKRYFFSILVCSILTITMSSCGVFNKQMKNENFDTFYDNFHQDIQFQIERVNFPIDGYFVEKGNKVSWSKSNWQIHKQKISTLKSEIYQKEINRSSRLVIEKLTQPNAHFYFERTFKLIHRKWFLVSCIDSSFE